MNNNNLLFKIKYKRLNTKKKKDFQLKGTTNDK